MYYCWNSIDFIVVPWFLKIILILLLKNIFFLKNITFNIFFKSFDRLLFKGKFMIILRNNSMVVRFLFSKIFFKIFNFFFIILLFHSLRIKVFFISLLQFFLRFFPFLLYSRFKGFSFNFINILKLLQRLFGFLLQVFKFLVVLLFQIFIFLFQLLQFLDIILQIFL